MKELIKKYDKNNSEFLESLKDSVIQGMINPLDAFIFLKKLEANVSGVIDIIKDGAVDEASKYGNEETLKDGVYFQVKASPGRYEYSDWVKEADAELKKRKLMEKEAYKLAIHKQTVINDDGEIVQPAKYSHGKQTISIKIPETK